MDSENAKRKPKIAILLPLYGNIPVCWFEAFIAFLNKNSPNYIWSIAIKQHNPVDKARNELVKAALKENPDYILFLDGDNLIPTDALDRMIKVMEDKKADLVTALYFQKGNPHMPVIRNYRYGGFWTIEDVEINKVIPIDGTGMGCCTPPDTLVLDENRQVKKIKKYKVGDKLITHKNKVRKVSNIMKRKYSGEMICIKPRYFRQEIKLTPEHPVFALKKVYKIINGRTRRNKKIEMQPIFINAGELTAEDFVAFPKPPKLDRNLDLNIKISDYLTKEFHSDDGFNTIYLKNSFHSYKNNSLRKISEKYKVNRISLGRCLRKIHSGIKDGHQSNESFYRIKRILEKENFTEKIENIKVKNIIRLDEKFARLYGLYIAEGSSFNGVIEFSFGKKEKDTLAIETSNLINELFGLISRLEIKDNVCRVVVCSRILEEFLEKISGKGAFNKEIKLIKELYLSEDKIIHSFLNGYIDGDGHRRKEFISMSTISQKLAYQLRDLFLYIGTISTLSKRKGTNEIQGRKVNSKDPYIITTYNNSKRYLEDKNYVYLPISIKKEKYDDWVYNLEVEEDNSYVLENFIVHNCLIRPDVFIRLEWPWFKFSYETWGKKKMQISEDLYFCRSMLKKDMKMFCDTGIISDHFGDTVGLGEYMSFENIRKDMITARDSLMNDIQKFTGENELEISQKIREGPILMKEEWNEKMPKANDEIKKFYKETKNYIYDLSLWHLSNRREFDIELLEQTKNQKPKNVLDIGCGIGINSFMIAKEKIDVTIADLDSYTLDFAEFRFKENKLPYKIWKMDKEENPPDKKYDAIMLFDVIEHIPKEELKILVEKLIKLKHKDTDIMLIYTPGKDVGGVGSHPMHFDADEEIEGLIKRLIKECPT